MHKIVRRPDHLFHGPTEQMTATAAQQGVAAVSQQLFDKVTRYHAAIGAEVSSSELTRLETKLIKEGQEACFRQEWEEALNLFTHALAVVEKGKTDLGTDTGNRGTLVHNVAFCLHCMGEFEAAKAYYEQSLECFKNAPLEVPMTKKVLNGVLYPERLLFELLYGGLNHNRAQMTKARVSPGLSLHTRTHCPAAARSMSPLPNRRAS